MTFRLGAHRVLRACGLALSLCAAAALSGCAVSQNPADPLESWNRGVFSFNERVDVAVLKPAAQAYVNVTPKPVRTGVNNFFGNIGDVWSSVNLFLQGRLKEGATSTMRVAVNSTLGLAGLIDLSTPMGITRYREDLGQTLGVWGVPPGPYIVWPMIGSSTLRDTSTIWSEMFFSASTLADSARQENMLRVLYGVSMRANYLNASDLVDQVALDKYAFMRDAYLQRRAMLIHDGRQGQTVQDGEEDADAAPQPRYDLPEEGEEASPVLP